MSLTNTVFRQAVEDAKQEVGRAASRSFLLKLFTLGFVTGGLRVANAKEALAKSQRQLQEYEHLTKRADNLDNDLDQFDVIEGIRVSRNTFSDLPAFGHDDYPPDWEELRKRVLERDTHSCQETDGTCDGPLQIHHIQELSKGGSNDMDNLITLCQHHHCKKHPHLMARHYGNIRR
jgi:hypothetical protein